LTGDSIEECFPHGSQKPTVKSQRSKANGQKPTVKSQKSKVNGQRSTVKSQRSKVKNQQSTTTMLSKTLLISGILLCLAGVASAQDFRVQAAAFADSISMSYFKTRGVGKVYLSYDQMGLYRYFVGTYNTRDEAAKVQQELVGKGFPNAAIIDLAEQRILCGANCPYFREGMMYVQDPSQKNSVFNVYFDFGRYSLNPESKAELDRVYQAMKTDATVKLKLLGHTDGVGDKDSNLKLATNRARSARNYLLNKGIRSERMSIRVFGESDPLTPNQDLDGKDLPESRKLNRRVTLALIAPGSGEVKNEEKEKAPVGAKQVEH